MKIAVTGKGGAGKTTVAAALASLMAGMGMRVLAVDADPDANLASALGVPLAAQKGIVAIAAQETLIEERTGGGSGGMFRLNPEVSDIAGRYAYRHGGVDLIVLGAVRRGGSGCACAGSALLRSLVRELVLRRDEALVLDMEAGIEHLGRATAQGVDAMLAVAEPGGRSVETVRRIAAMAGDIGIRRVLVVANRIRDPRDAEYIARELAGFEIAASIPHSPLLLGADRDGVGVFESLDGELRLVFEGLLTRIGDAAAGAGRAANRAAPGA